MMQTNVVNTRTWITTMMALVLTTLCVGVGAAPKKLVKQTAKKTTPQRTGRIAGDFTLRDFDIIEVENTTGGFYKIKADGKDMQATSPRYDIKAQHITMQLVQTGTPAGLHTKTATATVAVRVVYRNPDANETTTITCDRADYNATDLAKQLGRLNMTGNVRAVTRGPAYGDAPLVQNYTSAYVEFPDEDTMRFVGKTGGISGQIPEPAPRKKAGGAQ